MRAHPTFLILVVAVGCGSPASQDRTDGGPSSTTDASGGISDSARPAADAQATVLPCDTLRRGEWAPLTPPGFSTDVAFAAHAVTTDPHNAGRLYFGTNTQGMFRSDDCGATFTEIATGAGHDELRSGRQWQIVIDPVDSNVMYTNSGYGTEQYYKSVNGGIDWAPLVPGGETGAFESGSFVQHFAMDPTDHNHLILNPHFQCAPGSGHAAACLLESFDAGAHWRFNEGANAPTSGEGAGLWMEDAQHWYFALYFGGLARTSDGGAHWTRLFDQRYATPSHARGLDGALYVGGVFGLMRSTDGVVFDDVAGAPGTDAMVVAGDVVVVGRSSSLAWTRLADIETGPWTSLPDLTPLVPHPDFVPIFSLDYDPHHRVIYVALSNNGFWRYALP